MFARQIHQRQQFLFFISSEKGRHTGSEFLDRQTLAAQRAEGRLIAAQF